MLERRASVGADSLYRNLYMDTMALRIACPVDTTCITPCPAMSCFPDRLAKFAELVAGKRPVEIIISRFAQDILKRRLLACLVPFMREHNIFEKRLNTPSESLLTSFSVLQRMTEGPCRWDLLRV